MGQLRYRQYKNKVKFLCEINMLFFDANRNRRSKFRQNNIGTETAKDYAKRLR